MPYAEQMLPRVNIDGAGISPHHRPGRTIGPQSLPVRLADLVGRR